MKQHEWIRSGRKTAGWSQAELGKKVSVSQVQVSQWETGKAEPTVGQLGRLRKLFGEAEATLADTEKGTSMISKVKGKTEISLYLADILRWLQLYLRTLHTVQSF